VVPPAVSGFAQRLEVLGDQVVCRRGTLEIADLLVVRKRGVIVFERRSQRRLVDLEDAL
jgi:hypothetical protein